MANLVPEFISLLRDIRDNKYPQIIQLRDETKDFRYTTETFYDQTLTLKEQTSGIYDDTHALYFQTVTYGTQLKSDTGDIHDSTKTLYEQTLGIKINVDASETNVKTIESNVENIEESIKTLTEGLGFSINSEGHMIVTIPSATNIEDIYIDVNGHMIIVLV